MNLIIKRVYFLLIAILVTLILMLFAFKNVMVQYAFNHESQKVQKKYGVELKSSKVSYLGINTIQIVNFNAVKANSDTLAHIDSIKVKLSIVSLIALKINPLRVSIINSQINISDKLYKKDTLICDNITSSINESSKSKSVENLNTIIKRFFGLSTAEFYVRNFRVNFIDSTNTSTLYIPEWKYSNNYFYANSTISDGTNNNYLNIHGFANKKLNQLNISINGLNGFAKVPFIESILGINACFDSANITLNAHELSKNRIELIVKTNLKNLNLDGRRLAESTIQIDNAMANLTIKILPNKYCIDSTSLVKINKVAANVGFCFYPKPDPTIDLNIKTTETKWQELIESLPKGLFYNLNGMRVSGYFQYNLKVNLNFNIPDSLKIEPTLTSKNFSIQSFGNTNFYALNDTFTHKVYNDGVYVKSIFIGKSNRNFVPIENISLYLIWSVITSEDGSFYNHRGFDLDGIRYAMACNIREKRFARGGSTITQQLIKNLYLDQNKNITRKVEEVLIVWMIENCEIVSKDRMLEIYLNIIEWGPDIYGVSDACKYYFNKKPNEITLREALFLAYIIPRPTKFKYMFDDPQHLKPFMLSSFDFVAQKMLKRGEITESDYNSLLTNSNVELSGDAASVFNKPSIMNDSIDIEDFAN